MSRLIPLTILRLGIFLLCWAGLLHLFGMWVCAEAEYEPITKLTNTQRYVNEFDYSDPFGNWVSPITCQIVKRLRHIQASAGTKTIELKIFLKYLTITTSPGNWMEFFYSPEDVSMSLCSRPQIRVCLW